MLVLLLRIVHRRGAALLLLLRWRMCQGGKFASSVSGERLTPCAAGRQCLVAGERAFSVGEVLGLRLRLLMD